MSLSVNLKDLQDGLNLIMGFLKQNLLLLIQNSIKSFFLRIFRIKTRNCIQRLLHRLIKNLSRQVMKKGPNMITQSETPVPEEIEVHKYRRYMSDFSAATRETGLTVGKRASVTPVKHIPKKKKYIKSLALSLLIKYPIPNQDKKIMGLNKYQCLTTDIPPFLPGNKRLLNEGNDDNPETAYTSQYEKDDRSHTNRDYSIAKVKDKKIIMMMANTKRILRNIRAVMNMLVILKLQILCVMKFLSRQPKNKKH